ncbi:MAG TPA: hypothetical protein VHX44_15335 [Planctomycetota bacterium]|nr:hypothetical protein [Planctomycetota bacterium]
MHPAIGQLDRPAPAHDSADFGTLRARVLDAHLHHRPVLVPRSIAGELDAWAAEIITSAKGPTIGLEAAGVPDIWYDLLAWSGVPMSSEGPLRWGVDIEESAGTVPEFHGPKLVLPPPTVLAQLTSLALKPMRLLVANRLGCRLQAATGMHLFLWRSQAILVSHAEVPLGGFLHGPEPGMRHSLSVPVGGAQVIRW